MTDKPNVETRDNGEPGVRGRSPCKIVIAHGAWGEKIVAPKPKLFKHKSPLLPSGHISTYIVGASGSGKTTVMLELLPNIENVSQMFLFTLVLENPINAVIEDYCSSKGIHFAMTNNPEDGQKQLQDFIHEKPENTYGICLFDDFVKHNEPSISPYKVCLTSVTQFLRNYAYHNIVIAQSPLAIPEGARNNVNLRIIFKLESPKSVKVVREEFAGTGFGPESYFKSIYERMLAGGRYSYMVVVSDQDEPRIYLHMQKRGEDSIVRIPTYEQAVQRRKVSKREIRESYGPAPHGRNHHDTDEDPEGSDSDASGSS